MAVSELLNVNPVLVDRVRLTIMANLILADYLNIRDLLGHEKVILVKSGLDRISEILLRE